MGIIAVIVFVFFFAMAISFTARFLLWLMNRIEGKVKASIDISKNPYINYHKMKDKNESDYEAYLEWLEKNGSGAPVEKIKSPEDVRADNKIKKLL